MGSTGSGRFSDYSRSSGSGVGNEGSSGTDRCNMAFTCFLEEVEQCEYFQSNGDVPPANTLLSLELRGRIMAVYSNGATIGALPTRFNYLADCLNAGFTYQGRVVVSTYGAVANVSVDFAPDQS